MKRKAFLERGSAIVETLFCIFFLLLFIFSMLQIFDFFMAQMVTEYSAFRAVRSAIVGFNDENVHREGKLKAIAASGPMVFPIDLRRGESGGELFSSPAGQFYWERFAIIDYLECRRDLDYQYWSPHGKVDFGGNDSENSPSNFNSYLPQSDLEGASVSETEYKVTSFLNGNTLNLQAKFEKYPWTIFLMLGKKLRYMLYGGEDSLDIASSQIGIAAHSNLYLE